MVQSSRRSGQQSVSVISLRSWARFCLCYLLFWLPTLGQCDPLPLIANLYYTVVSAGFDNLNFSLHYTEYGNGTGDSCYSAGRYYQPNAIELVDANQGIYYLYAPDVLSEPGGNCGLYPLANVQNIRLMECASSLLMKLDLDGVDFTRTVGVTYDVRLQPSVHYSTSMSYSTATGIPQQAAHVDNFLQLAYTTAGVNNSSPYSVNVTIDVYYASDANAALKVAGNGATPLRFAITGSRTDANGIRPLNIVYDFMQWGQVDPISAAALLVLPLATECLNGTIPPPIPSITELPPSDIVLPSNSWNHCNRVTVELAASTANGNTMKIMQVDSLLWSEIGAEIIVSLADPSQMLYTSQLYLYSAYTNYQFSKGYVYTLNGSTIIPNADINAVQLSTRNSYTANDILAVSAPPSCDYETITPQTESPLQWLHGGVLNTIIANPSFLNGAQFTGRTTIRGIVADTWNIHLTFTAKYASTVYNFALQIFTTTSGWTNMGRIVGPSLGRQLLRLAYEGNATTAGVTTPYTLQMEFFMQFKWNVSTTTFDPMYIGCPAIGTPTTSTSSLNTDVIIGTTVGGGGGSLLLVAAGVLAYRAWKRGHPLLARLFGDPYARSN